MQPYVLQHRHFGKRHTVSAVERLVHGRAGFQFVAELVKFVAAALVKQVIHQAVGLRVPDFGLLRSQVGQIVRIHHIFQRDITPRQNIAQAAVHPAGLLFGGVNLHIHGHAFGQPQRRNRRQEISVKIQMRQFMHRQRIKTAPFQHIHRVGLQIRSGAGPRRTLGKIHVALFLAENHNQNFIGLGNQCKRR